MLNHSGFHFGRLGLWDPRTDTILYDLDEVYSVAKVLGISANEMLQITQRHEWSHRMFFNTRAIQDICGIAVLINNLQFHRSRSELTDEDRRFVANSMPKLYQRFVEIDPILDAQFALVLHFWKKSERSPEQLWRLVASNISNKESEQAFYDLFWLYSNSRLDNIKRITLILKVVGFTLQVGTKDLLGNEGPSHLDDSALVSNYLDNPSPKTLFKLVIHMLQEIKSTGWEDVYDRITRRGSLQTFELKLCGALASYKKASKKDKEVLLSRLSRLQHEQFRLSKLLHMRAKSALFRRAYDSGIPNHPALTIFKIGGIFELDSRPKMRRATQQKYLTSFLLNHVRDCLNVGAQPKCFLCETRVKECNRSFHPVIERLVEHHDTN